MSLNNSLTGIFISDQSTLEKLLPSTNRWIHYIDLMQDGYPWSVFVLNDIKSSWVNFKICTEQEHRPEKNNFWVASNGERVSQSKDAEIALNFQPWVVDFANEHHGKAMHLLKSLI